MSSDFAEMVQASLAEFKATQVPVGSISPKRHHCAWVDPVTLIRCPRQFHEVSNYKVHYRLHTGSRPYGCRYENCSRNFRSMGNREDHERRHYGIRPYRCSIPGCKASYFRRYQMLEHMQKSKVHKGCKISKNQHSKISKSTIRIILVKYKGEIKYQRMLS